MNHLLKSKNLPYATLALSALSLLLRVLLYRTAVDERGLIVSGHPLEILLWLVTAGAAALAVATVWKLDGSNRYGDNFSASTVSAVGTFVMAAGILLTIFGMGWGDTGLEKIRSLLGFAAAASLVIVGLHRMQGKRPLFLLHMAVCVFFGVFMVSLYQSWRNDPQLQDYVFSLLGCLLLMLFAFYQTAFDVGSGKRRMQLGTGLLAVYCCVAALANTEHGLLYFTGAVWTFTNLCALTPAPKKKDAPEAPKE